ncbi:MAG TPA: PQQ-dependent sugar dehydrogenase [Gemmatimonadales bacterium]|nr:PQQ-dependent sugar dehydrogenase [Gemmatimonadales bacterium]
MVPPRQLLLAALVLGGCAKNPPASAQQIPADFQPHVVADNRLLYLPPGFKIGLYAQHLDGIRNIVLGPGGVPYAVYRTGSVVKLPDTNGDGVADTVITVVSGLNRPFGLAFRGDTMYVGETDGVKRYLPGNSVPQQIVSGLPGGGNHWTRTLAFGPDGKLYVSIGSSCNICDETDRHRATVTRYNSDGSGEHIFATGLRNSVGLAFNPTTGELWATNNDRDNLGDDRPPEKINILKDGRFYGWPTCWLPGERNPEYPQADCSTVQPPAITYQAHSAPLGMAFYTGTQFPADYRGDAFVAFHGSWNRSVPTGDKVARFRVKDGKPVGLEDFIVGWQLPNGSRWGRPVAILVMPDGAMLVSDDDGARVWRVAYGEQRDKQ